MTTSDAAYRKVTTWLGNLNYEQCVFIPADVASEAFRATDYEDHDIWLNSMSKVNNIQSIYIHQCNDSGDLLKGYIFGRFKTQDELNELYRKFSFEVEGGFVYFCQKGSAPVTPSVGSSTTNNPNYGMYS